MNSTHQAKDHPRLTAKLRREPARCVGNKRKRRCQHQYPQHPARLEQLAPPEQEEGQSHDSDEDGTQSYHDMIAVIDQLDGIGELITRESVESLDGCLPATIGQKTQGIWHDDGIVNCAGSRVWLPDNDDARAAFRLEKPLHRG